MPTDVSPLDAQELTEPRVQFGPRGNQTMPLSWAESILTTWCERDPARFGRALAEAATGVPPTGGRSSS